MSTGRGGEGGERGRGEVGSGQRRARVPPEHMPRGRGGARTPASGDGSVWLSGSGLLSAAPSSPVSPAVRGLIFFSSRAEKAQHRIRQHAAAYSASPRNPITGQRGRNSLPSPPSAEVGRRGAARPAREIVFSKLTSIEREGGRKADGRRGRGRPGP